MGHKAPKSFEAGVKSFVSSINRSKFLAQWLANEAIQHFYDHGDVSKCQTLLNTFEEHGKNFVRKAAFMKWLKEFSPIDMKEGKLKKKEGGEFDESLIAKAKETPFWEYSPDPEDVVFEFDDVVQDLNRVLKKYAGERYKPASEDDVQRLKDLETKVHRLLPQKEAVNL